MPKPIFDSQKAKRACEYLSALAVRRHACRWIVCEAGRRLLVDPVLKSEDWRRHFLDRLRTIDWIQSPSVLQLDLSPKGLRVLNERYEELYWPDSAGEIDAELQEVAEGFALCAFPQTIPGGDLAWWYPAAFLEFKPIGLGTGVCHLFASNKQRWPELPKPLTLDQLLKRQGRRLDDAAVTLFESRMEPFKFDPISVPPTPILYHVDVFGDRQVWLQKDPQDPHWHEYLDQR